MKLLVYGALGFGIAYLIWPAQIKSLLGMATSAAPTNKTQTGDAAPLSNPTAAQRIGSLSIAGSKYGSSLTGSSASVSP